MRVLVTGAAGFVGSRLLARLAEAGHAVTGIDREVDVTRARAVDAAVAEAAPDAVVHLAALSFVPDSLRAPRATFGVNFLGTLHLLEAVRSRAPRARVLVVGTGTVYGAARGAEHAFSECAPLRPESPYARAKAAADRLARHFAEDGLDVVRVRPFNHTGRGRPEAFVESSLARQIVEIAAGRRAPRILVGNVDAVRDFLDVEDVVAAYLLLLDRKVPAAVYNVASGVGVTVRMLIDRLIELGGLAARRAEIAVEVEPARWRPTDSVVGDASRLREATDWAPRIPLDATLRALLSGWRDAPAGAP